MRMHKVVKQMIVVLGLLVFANTSMASPYETVPLRADNTVVNIFHSVNGRPTIAKDYFVKKILTQTELSRGYNPEVYELRKCPDGATSCNGREIHLQDFWKNANFDKPFTSHPASARHKIWIIPENLPHEAYPYVSEGWGSTHNAITVSRQCVAFAKMLVRNSYHTGTWVKSSHGKTIQQSLEGISLNEANNRDRGKIIAYFAGANPYPGSGTSQGYAHVGMLLEYVYSPQGNPVGFWMVNANFFGTGNQAAGPITKQLMLFDNGARGSLNASNYHFVHNKK